MVAFRFLKEQRLLGDRKYQWVFDYSLISTTFEQAHFVFQKKTKSLLNSNRVFIYLGPHKRVTQSFAFLSQEHFHMFR